MTGRALVMASIEGTAYLNAPPLLWKQRNIYKYIDGKNPKLVFENFRSITFRPWYTIDKYRQCSNFGF